MCGSKRRDKVNRMDPVARKQPTDAWRRRRSTAAMPPASIDAERPRDSVPTTESSISRFTNFSPRFSGLARRANELRSRPLGRRM